MLRLSRVAVDGPGTDWSRCYHIYLVAVLGHPTQSGFLESELLFDHPERVFDLGADVCLGSLDQILQTPIGVLREGAAFA